MVVSRIVTKKSVKVTTNIKRQVYKVSLWNTGALELPVVQCSSSKVCSCTYVLMFKVMLYHISESFAFACMTNNVTFSGSSIFFPRIYVCSCEKKNVLLQHIETQRNIFTQD